MSTTSQTGERRFLVDGKLVDAGATFENVNPFTERPLGVVADATAADMQAAVEAARRAFDGTEWATDHTFRKARLLQLQAALEREREELRRQAEDLQARYDALRSTAVYTAPVLAD